MSNPTGKGGFGEHPDHIHRPSPAAMAALGRLGGARAAQRAREVAREAAIDEAMKQLTAVIPEQARPVMAALYELGWARGYTAAATRQRRPRRQPSVETR
jgi:hypothetical protein